MLNYCAARAKLLCRGETFSGWYKRIQLSLSLSFWQETWPGGRPRPPPLNWGSPDCQVSRTAAASSLLLYLHVCNILLQCLLFQHANMIFKLEFTNSCQFLYKHNGTRLKSLEYIYLNVDHSKNYFCKFRTIGNYFFPPRAFLPYVQKACDIIAVFWDYNRNIVTVLIISVHPTRYYFLRAVQ